MKKILLFVSLIMALNVSAQVLYEQDFENGIGNMILVDNDGNTPAANVSSYTEAWNIRFVGGDSAAVSNSWYSPAGTADDWMITPAINITSADAVLEWEAYAVDPSYPDGYEVLISTTTTDLASFTDVAFTVTAEATSWTSHQVSLANYNGQNIYVAFRNNSTDMFLLVVDNIKVRIPLAVEGTLAASGDAMKVITAPGGTVAFDFEYTNTGMDDATAYDFVYTVDGGAAVTLAQTTTVTPGSSVTLMTNELGVGAYTIVASVQNVNGTGFNSNEVTVDVQVVEPVPQFTGTDSHGDPVDLHQLLADGKTVVLDFFASWCGPCQTSTPILNTAYVSLGSGDEYFEVLGITVETTDDDAVVNGLGWGATYPKISWQAANGDMWNHFDGLYGSGGIPLFVMICPDMANPGFSSVIWSHVGSNIVAADIEAEAAPCIQANGTEELVDVNINVYPNPSNGLVNIENVQGANIVVYNMLGEVVATVYNADQFNTVDLSNAENGTYMVQITSAKQTVTKKVVLNK